ncbi:TonB-dependent receptor [Pseudoalteromonas fuliginea]|uniref:TonB-dependent receptor n=1 Tax=Pseudoalteromonas fuliginea TaxID=1872678 RepID=A0ABQ6RG98_9GAMM|nr:TonB-dependent receptor [Pseudoalteromonas fuliginea]KAA1154075.1 TonB-dependent receptor [Pseudoalteromonas fuliginea]KAA1166693.1 TonB-dependent receptor [Pseudoalteromonas fuliginea]
MKQSTVFTPSIIVSATLALSAGFTTTTYAAEEAKKVERIQVTGSRIKRTDIEGPSPVQSIGRAEIENMGYDNLQQLLERMPVAGSGTFSTRGNNQDSTANGSAAVSLRGLGADATLVLINGRRVSISAFAEGITNSFVDINSIPVSAIERIDILKDGASAIYGSDAVAGVVNVILKKDIDGVEINLGYGGTDGPNYEETTASLVWGTTSEKSSASVIIDYFKNTSLSSDEMGRLGTANQSPYGGEDFRSSRGFPGYFYVDGVKTIDPDCPAENATSSGSCLFDYGPYGYISPASERIGAISQFEYRFDNGITGFLEMAVQHNSSVAAGAPTPLDEDAGLTVPASHPNNPFGEDIQIGRYRTVDAGARQWDIESDTLRFVAGLKGEINDWSWETAVQKGRSKSLQTGDRTQGWVRTDFLQQEIDAGNYNPFGGTYNDPTVVDRITTSLVRRGESHMTSFDANITGEAFSFGGEAVMMAAGIEYREEDVNDIPDDQFQRGLIFGTESVSASADRDQYAAYVEFSIPLAENLELQLAGRYDDYSDFGTTTNPKAALRWAPTDEVTVRGSWAQGFRAPSLAQIGLGPSQKSQFFVDTQRCEQTGLDCQALDYNIEFSGNPDLQAEESESWNVGVIWAPTAEFGLSVDVWSITQDNKIDEEEFGPIYAAECGNQSSTVCVRLAPTGGASLGTIQKIHSTFKNLSSQEVSGVDVSANYNHSLDDLGLLKFNLEWAYQDKFEKDGRDYTGEYGYPEHRFIFSTNWEIGDFNTNVNISYVGEFEDTPDIDFDGNLDFDSNTSRMIDSQTLVDLQTSYRITESTKISLGVNNLFDEEPPFAIGDGDGDLYGYASGVHNPRGRYLYTKVSFSF